MSSQNIQTMPFTQIVAFKGYLDNLGKPLNSTLICFSSVKEFTESNAVLSHEPLLFNKYQKVYYVIPFSFFFLYTEKKSGAKTAQHTFPSNCGAKMWGGKN